MEILKGWEEYGVYSFKNEKIYIVQSIIYKTFGYIIPFSSGNEVNVYEGYKTLDIAINESVDEVNNFKNNYNSTQFGSIISYKGNKIIISTYGADVKWCFNIPFLNKTENEYYGYIDAIKSAKAYIDNISGESKDGSEDDYDIDIDDDYDIYDSDDIDYDSSDDNQKKPYYYDIYDSDDDIDYDSSDDKPSNNSSNSSGTSGTQGSSGSADNTTTASASTTSVSIGNASDVYTKIFGLEGIDDNNKYASLSGSELCSVQLIEPTISVDEITIPQEARKDAYIIPDRQSYRIPLVMINDTYIDQAVLNNFVLDYSSFIPTVSIEFVDTKNLMLSVNSMKDGSLIKVYIGGLGDESYYKPIRQDFLINDIKKIGGGRQNDGDNIQYKVSGKLNVPVGYKKESWSNFACTSQQELFNLAVYTGLGYATNFDKGTNDKMKWQNMPNTDYMDFIRDITNHSCYSLNTFFTSFIDQHYVLNFIECHSLLSHGGKKTDMPSIIYNNIQHNEDIYDADGKQLTFKYKSEKEEDETQNKVNSTYNNPIQKLTYYYLSNNECFNGWTNFIEEYVELSNGSSSTSDGYKRNIGYSDANAGDWGMSSVKFSIPPIDNMNRDSSTQKIQSLNTLEQDTYIPINIVQLTNPQYANESSTSNVSANNKGASNTSGSVDDISVTQSFTFFGNVDTTNMYKLYYFANEQNDFQMNCMKRCGIKVKLQNFNPSITKFSRIWVDIYDKNKTSNINISKIKDESSISDDAKKVHNSNVISFDGEGKVEFNNKTVNNSLGDAKYNRGLSGWYVITELKYIFDKKLLRINTFMVLNRIEKKPLYQNEYDIAKKGIEKYKEDNLVEKIIINTDDNSYAAQNASEESGSTDTSTTSTES